METTFKIAVSRYYLDHKLPPGDPSWAQFNAGFDNYDADIPNLTRAINAGRSITTQHKDHWRVTENYLCGQHLGLDFDNGDASSSIPTLLKDKFISRYAAFLYTTMSHTDEAPRSRAIFLLDTPIMQAKNYALAASSLVWLYGAADQKCKDAVRFFYGAQGCHMEILGNVLPLEVVKKLITNYQESGLLEKRHAVKRDYTAPASQQEVQDALRFIPPWSVDYQEWVNILMGIHSQFGDGGFSLAASWADGKQGEIESKWRSFKETGNASGAVTIATVFAIAKRFGWKKGA